MEQDLDTVSNMFLDNANNLEAPVLPEQPQDTLVPATPAQEVKYNTAIGQVINDNKELFNEAGITGHRLNYFMSQMAHESGGFRYMEEIDPSLSNLGNKGGEAYKGRGIIQLTGINNYRYYGQKLGLDLENNPELAADPVNSLKIAVEYWKQNKLNDYADRGDIRGITRIINGPAYTSKSLASREDWYQRAAAAQLDDPAALAEALAGKVGAPVKLKKQAASVFDSTREEERALGTGTKVYRKEDDSWFPSVTKSYERAKLSQADGVREVVKTKADDAFKQIEELTKIAPPSKGMIETFSDWAGFTPDEVEQAQEKKRFDAYIAQVKEQAPDIAIPFQSYNDVATAAMEEIVSRKDMADRDIGQLYEQGDLLSDIGTVIGSIAGGMGGFLSDTENAKLAAVTAVVTGGASLPGQMAAGAIVNAGQEAIGDINARALEEQIGIERTPEETVHNLTMAAAAGAAIPVVGRGLKLAYQAYKGTPAGDMAGKALNDIIDTNTGVSPDMSPFGDSPTGNAKLDAIINKELVETSKTGLPPAPIPDTVKGVRTPEVEVKLQESDDLLRSLAETPQDKKLVEEVIAARREAVGKADTITPKEYEAQVQATPESVKTEFKQILDSQQKDVAAARVAVQETQKAVDLNTKDLKAKDVYLKDLQAQLDTIAAEASDTNLKYNSFADKTAADAALAKKQLEILGQTYEDLDVKVNTVDSVTNYLDDSVKSVKESIAPLKEDLDIHRNLIQESEVNLAALDEQLKLETDTSSARYGFLKAQQDELKSGLNASRKILTDTEKTVARQEKRLGGLEKRLSDLTESTDVEMARFQKALDKTDQSLFKTELEARKSKLQKVIDDHQAALEGMAKEGDNQKVQWEDSDGIVKEGTVKEYRADIDSDKRALDLIVGCATNIGA